jgi:hypothetical protein
VCEETGKTESMAENSHEIYGQGRATRLSREKATRSADIVAPPPTSCQWCKHRILKLEEPDDDLSPNRGCMDFDSERATPRSQGQEVARMLLKYGADIKAWEEEGSTPLASHHLA